MRMPYGNWNARGAAMTIVACSGLMGLAGCGESGPGKYHVSGEVTYRGEPVPAGMVTFSPDTRRGNSGHQGFAEIRDGRYSTSSGNGRGTAGGPHIVAVLGFDGQNPTEESPQGKMLFPEYRLEHDIADGRTTLDLVVPE